MKHGIRSVGVLLLFVVAAHAENWPGLNGGGTAANSCPTAIGTNINVKWMLRLDPQTYNSRGGGAMRSKNMVLRDGEIALLAPGSASTDLAFYDAALGGFKRAFPSTLLKTGNAEWNPIGVEGRDLRNGQHLVYWHSNGNVYCRSHGDNMQRVVLRASDGTLQPNVGASGSNQSGYFLMSDNSIWHFMSGGGHQGQIRYFIMQDAGGTLATKSFGGDDGTLFNYFTWCGSMLMDGDWVYVLGATTHPDLGWAEAATDGYRYQWLGARVRGYKVLGQTATTNNQNFVNGSNGSFAWGRTNAFIANDHDLASAVKPWCLGRSNVFVVTESATWTTNTATVDFTQPMRLSAISRTNGAEEFTLQLGITGAGCSVSPNFGYYGGGTTWRPQVAYADRTATDGREYVSILLPEAVSLYGWLYPKINPTNSNASLNTRLSMVDAVTRTELWTYQYPRGGTTPVLAQDVNTCTKQIIAGDALYVVFTKTAVPIENYISTNILSDLNLYVDRFALADGAKTSFVFPLGVQANTMQLDDLAAANGKLYALITYREWPYNATYWPYSSSAPNGAQALVALGAVTPGNTAPVFSQAPAASSTNITPPVVTVTLTARATDSVTPSLAWNKVTGPAAVFFSTNNSAAATNVTCTFQKAGTYLIECRASDGDLSVTGTVLVTVNNPATTVKVAAADATASEPGLGDGTGTFRLTRTGGETNVPMTVNVAVTGTASNGVDYATLSNAVVIPAGATDMTVSVAPLDDALIEGPESVTLTIQAAALAYLVGTPDDATVTINDDDIPATNVAPVASNLVITLNEDTPAAVTLAGSDGNGDPLTYTVLDSPLHGVLSGTAPDLIYTPALNYYGPDLFTYRAHDGYVFSATATGAITVASINDVPEAEAQHITAAFNTAKAFTLTAADADGDALTYVIGTGPTNGTLSGAPPSLTYTPTNGFSGRDGFFYTASDGVSTSAAAAVSIVVYPPSGDWITDGNGHWSEGTNWSLNAAPNGIGSFANMTNNITAARIVTLDGNITLGALTIGDFVGTAFSFTLTNSASQTITLDSGGAGSVAITKTTASSIRATDTIYPDIILNTNLSLTVNGSGIGFNLNVYGAISGAGRSVTYSGNNVGSGAVLYNAGSSYSGRTIVYDSVGVTYHSIGNVGGGNSSLGAPATVADGTIQFGSGAGLCRLTYAGAVSAGTDRILDMVGATGATRSLQATGAGNVTFTSPFVYSGGGFTGTLGVSDASATAYVIILGAVTNAGFSVTVGSATASGNGALLGLNTYTNTTTIRRGTLVINSIANADGTPSSLGAPSTPAHGTVSLNSASTVIYATLKYIGAGHSSDRVIALAGTTAGSLSALDASGYGKLTLSGGVANSEASNKSLTLTGSGEGEMSGVISDYDATRITSLTKSGSGTWTVRGNNQFTGAVTLNGAGGRLIMGHTNAFGLGGGSIALTAGTLEPGDADRAIANPVTLTAHTIAGSNSLALSGKVTGATGQSPALTSSLDAGRTLTLSNGVDIADTSARVFILAGTGDTTISGIIANGGAGTGSVRFRNRGTTTIIGTNTYTGYTSICGGGRVILDYGASDGDNSKLGDGGVLYLAYSGTAAAQGGGDLVLKGGTHTEVVASTTMSTYGHFNVIRQGEGATSKLQMGAITLNGGASLDFSEDDLATTDNVNYNGILKQASVNNPAVATVGGTDWAYNSTGGAGGLIKALPAGSYSDYKTTSADAANLLLTGSYTNTTSSKLCNSIKIVSDGNDQLLDTGTNRHVGTTFGGVLYAGGGNNKYTICGTGAFMGGANTRSIVVAGGAELTMDVPIGNSAACNILKFGAGRAVLATNNTTAGAIRITEGALRLKHSGASGTTAGGIFVAVSPSGSALELDKDRDGNVISIGAEALTINGNGITNSGALRNISGNNTYGGTVTMEFQGARINSDADTLTMTNTITTAAGNDVTFGGAGNITVSTMKITGAGTVTKDGTGTLTLAAANDYTGVTAVNAGTLKVTGSIASNSPVRVNAGGTLGGNGTCYGTVRVYGNGTIRTEGGNLTAGSLILDAGATVGLTSGVHRIVVSSAGALSDALGLTLLPGAKVAVSGVLSAGGYDLIQYSGVIKGSVTNLAVLNPAAGQSYTFLDTGSIVQLQVVQDSNPDSNANGIPDEWEQQVFGNLTNSATGDNDGDGLDNFGEWVAGTHPTNGGSVFMFTNLVQNAGAGRVLSWYSESNRFYTLGLSSNLLLDPFSSTLTNRMPANPPVNVYTDTVERFGASFYRVTVTNQ